MRLYSYNRFAVFSLLPFGQSDYMQTVWCFYFSVEPLSIIINLLLIIPHIILWLFQSLYFGDMWQEPTVLDHSLQDPFAREGSISWALINKTQTLLKAAVTLSPLDSSTFDNEPPGQCDNLCTKRSFCLASKLVADATWSSHHASLLTGFVGLRGSAYKEGEVLSDPL